MEFNLIAFNLENVERHLLDYLPPFLQQVEEFAAINAANEPEIKLAWQGVGRVLGNQFLAEADGGGLAVWERELGIFAKDTESLSLRRARIKAAWQRQPPYTLRWLRGLLDGLCGVGNYTANVQDYTINILLDYDKLAEPGALLREILEILKPVRPANMLIEGATQFRELNAATFAGGAVCGSWSINAALPALNWELPVGMEMYAAGGYQGIMQTTLPKMGGDEN